MFPQQLEAHTIQINYPDLISHWSPLSEAYAGGDSLITILNDGWAFIDLVFRHTIWRGGSRAVIVYYFELKRGTRMVTMPVISNPYVERLILQHDLQIVTLPDDELVYQD